jgi:hypothetical protein
VAAADFPPQSSAPFHADALYAERSLVVSDPGVAVGLMAAGIHATTYADLRSASDPGTLAMIGNGPAVLVLDPTARGMKDADVVRARLSRLGVVTRLCWGLFDRRLP